MPNHSNEWLKAKQSVNHILDIAYPNSKPNDKVKAIYDDSLPKALKDAALFIFTYGDQKLNQKDKQHVHNIKLALIEINKEGQI